MLNKSKWIYNYNGLSPDSQLEVAEAIVDELRDNELTFDESEYDKEKSRIIREFFDTIVLNLEENEELKKVANILGEVENLSQNNKRKVIDEVFGVVVKYLGIQKQENKEKVCHQEGHIFGKWEHNICTTYIDTVIDHQRVHNFPVEHENWKRTCSRCGFVDVVDHEPQELIDTRKEKNKKARIKRLESELRRLKNEEGLVKTY